MQLKMFTKHLIKCFIKSHLWTFLKLLNVFIENINGLKHFKTFTKLLFCKSLKLFFH